MLITNYSKEANNEILRIHDGSFPFPNINSSSFIQKKLAIDKGKFIGCGLIKLTSEFILLLDQSSPIRSRILALEQLKENIIPELRAAGINESHIFTNESIGKLSERFGFERCSPAYVLNF